MKILSFDMGFRNTAWALANNDKIMRFGMLQNPISDLAHQFNFQKRHFLREFKELTSELKQGDAIVAERFSVRGFNPGAQVELVSLMLGLMAGNSPVPFKLVMAANWKNYIASKYTNLKERNSKLKKGESKAKFEMEDFLEGSEYAEHEHICDAIGISQWFYEHETQTDSKFLKEWSEK